MSLQTSPKLLQDYLSPSAYGQLKLEKLKRKAQRSNSAPLWQPNPDRDGIPNPQRLALESEADILGYGGQAGSGKTGLAIGLAATGHKRSVIFRRVFPNLRGTIEESRAVFNPEGKVYGKNSYNESLHRWTREADPEWMLEFGAMQHEKDKKNWHGRPHDLYVFDEASEFTRTQVEYVIGWNRSTLPGQRCRVVLTFNPPTDDAGNWIIDYFLPWIAYLFPDDYTYPNPAKPGELRWFTTINGKETEVDSGEPMEIDGKIIKPLSRTFIPGKLADNPHLANTNYEANLQALPEPLRSQLLYGDFAAHKQADPMQVLPTAWVRAAQTRWMERERPEMPLSGVGVDVARGGRDALVISKRYGTWFDEPKSVPGVNVEDGPAAAGMVYDALAKDDHIGYINIDVAGVGSSPYDSLKVMYPKIVAPVNAATGSIYVVRAKSGDVIIKMKNTRAEYYWRMREALDPAHGLNIALPPGNEVLADLCAAKYKWLAGGVVQIEEKDDIKQRIGRSPDVGEAILLANHVAKKVEVQIL